MAVLRRLNDDVRGPGQSAVPSSAATAATDLLAIAHRAVRLLPATERAVADCHGPDAGHAARECAHLLVDYYRLRGELAALSLTGPLLVLRGSLDSQLLCHQFVLHEAAVAGYRAGGSHGGTGIDHRVPDDLEPFGAMLREIRDSILEYVPHAGTSLPVEGDRRGPARWAWCSPDAAGRSPGGAP